MSHITIAASSKAFVQLFNKIRDNFTFSKSDSGNFGPFSASYSVAMHLEDGTIQLNNDDTVEVKHLKIVWDTLKVQVCFNLPGFCIGGWCIIPDPWNGCLVGVPKICIGGPICVPLDLSGLVSEVNDLKANLNPVYFVDPARTAGESDLDAEFAGHPNKWRIFFDPVFVHVDPIDIPASVANIIENIVRDAIESMFPVLPGFIVDALLAAIGPILDLVKGILGIVGEINDWLTDLLMNTFDLLGIIETAIADYFAAKTPIYEFEDPYPILDAGPGLIPVKIPIRNLASHVNSQEMIVTADVG
ncbi:MAG TPA: hypothetical protein VKR43_10935 [Bryobacteraceae bacterium]|nr:hypothetical protein [Bryobacteraceae bacterium]